MWKSTPTTGLDIILNQKPPCIEILGVAIKSYIRIKDVVKKSWDGIAHNKRLASHLLTLKNVTKIITHEGITINTFESDYLREPFFNWNPSTRSILTIACDNDIDDNLEQLDFDSTDDNDNDVNSNEGENPLAGNDDDNNFAAGENLCVNNDTRGVVDFRGNQPTHNGLLYSHFTNNWEIIAQKFNQLDLSGALIIRAIIFKNKNVLFNHKYWIKGTENVSLATIAVTTVLCSWYFKHAARGDTLDCFWGASHKGVLVAKTRNIHISRFIGILNGIKAKIGIYPIVSATKRNWSEFLAGNISYDMLEILPSKTVILPPSKII